jgi:hypothetical protein
MFVRFRALWLVSSLVFFSKTISYQNFIDVTGDVQNIFITIILDQKSLRLFLLQKPAYKSRDNKDVPNTVYKKALFWTTNDRLEAYGGFGFFEL